MAIQTTVPELNLGDSIDSRIPIHWKKKFSEDVFHLVQSEGSKLMPFFRKESLAGAESLRVDFYEKRTAKRRLLGRNTTNFKRNTPVDYTAQKMGSVTLFANAIYDADIFDKFDVMRQSHDVMSNVKKSSALAIGREIDAVILEAFKGKQVFTPSNAENLSDTVNNWPSYKNALAASDGVYGGENPQPPQGWTGLNLETLLQIKEYFLTHEVIKEGQTINLTVRTKDLMSLLRDYKLTNSDYATVKALVNGELDYFMGIRFVRIDHSYGVATQYQDDFQAQLGDSDPVSQSDLNMNMATGYLQETTSAIAKPIGELAGLVAFVEETPLGGASLGIAMEMEVTTKFDVIPELFHSTQYLAETSFGASRLDPKATLQVIVVN